MRRRCMASGCGIMTVSVYVIGFRTRRGGCAAGVLVACIFTHLDAVVR